MGTGPGQRAYRHALATVKDATAGSSLKINVVGAAATFEDLNSIGEHDQTIIELSTVITIFTILVIVYRNLVAMLMPLFTIGVTMGVAQQVVAAMAEAGLPIGPQTLVLMTGMMMGAGVDYAVFLFSRYQECLRKGMGSDDAVINALATVGEVITGSAATVALTFLGLSFATLAVFLTVGPRTGRHDRDRRGWCVDHAPGPHRARWTAWVGETAEGHHRTVLAPVCGPHRAAPEDPPGREPGDPAGAGRLFVLGEVQLRRPKEHPRGRGEQPRLRRAHEALPRQHHDAAVHHGARARRRPEIAEVVGRSREQMASRISQVPGIDVVRGITRPNGEMLQEAKSTYQAGEVGSKLGDASGLISSNDSNLSLLSGGARKMSDVLNQVRDQVIGSMADVRSMVGGAQ